MACSMHVTGPGQMIGMILVSIKHKECIERLESDASVARTCTALYLRVHAYKVEDHTRFSLAFFLTGSSGSPTGGLGRPCMSRIFFLSKISCAPSCFPIRSRRKVQAGVRVSRYIVVEMAHIRVAERRCISQGGSSISAVITCNITHYSRSSCGGRQCRSSSFRSALIVEWAASPVCHQVIEKGASTFVSSRRWPPQGFALNGGLNAPCLASQSAYHLLHAAPEDIVWSSLRQ